MPNNTIPDWKKATIVAMYQKYGYRSIANRLGIDLKTARSYQKRLEEEGSIEMDSGINMEASHA